MNSKNNQMKLYSNSKLVALFILLISIVSCSSSDDDNGEDIPNDTNYFPLVVNNSWEYNTIVTSPGVNDFVSQETLTLNNSSQQNGNTIYEFETDNPVNAAPTTSALSQGSVYKSGNSLFYTGAFGLGIPDLPSLNFNIEDAPIYQKNSPLGEELFSISDTQQEQIEGFPITISYTLSTETSENFSTLEVNGTSYNDVISSKIIVNVEIEVSITDPIPANVPILPAQNAVIITNYFAKDIGLIKSETNTEFEFIDVPIPDFQLIDINFFTLQEITDYNVNLE